MSVATCQVKDGSGAYQATTNGVNVTPGNTVTIKLASEAGADTWTIECVYTDETSTAPTLTVDSITKTATFTAPTAGKALIFKSTTIENGDTTNQPDVKTFGVYTLTSTGARVMAFNEVLESSATFGWTGTINRAIRLAGALPTLSTAYTVDFSAQTAQTISANGTVTIDGKAWTYANFANTNAAAISASGLTIAPNATNSSYTGATRTAPIISIPVSTLLSGFDLFANDIRISLYMSANNADANTEIALVGLECTSAPIGTNVSLAKGFAAAAASIRTTSSIASTSTAVDETTNTTDNVLVVQFSPRLLRFETRSGVWSAGFPATTRPRRMGSISSASAGFFANSTDLSLFLCVQPGNTSNNFSTTFHTLKVEAIY